MEKYKAASGQLHKTQHQTRTLHLTQRIFNLPDPAAPIASWPGDGAYLAGAEIKFSVKLSVLTLLTQLHMLLADLIRSAFGL